MQLAVLSRYFSPSREGYYLVATQAIYQDGSLDPTPQAGDVMGMVLIDRQPPTLIKFDVLLKQDEALLLWRFADVGTGRVVVEWSGSGRRHGRLAGTARCYLSLVRPGCSYLEAARFGLLQPMPVGSKPSGEPHGDRERSAPGRGTR